MLLCLPTYLCSVFVLLLPHAQCFVGPHRTLTIVGSVFLVLVGFLIPITLGALLWLNRSRLRDKMFALKVCFEPT